MVITVLILSVTLDCRTAIVTGLVAVCAASVRARSRMCRMVWRPKPGRDHHQVRGRCRLGCVTLAESYVQSKFVEPSCPCIYHEHDEKAVLIMH